MYYEVVSTSRKCSPFNKVLDEIKTKNKQEEVRRSKRVGLLITKFISQYVVTFNIGNKFGKQPRNKFGRIINNKFS